MLACRGLDYLLRWYQFPPRLMPALRTPSQYFKSVRSALSRAQRTVLPSISCSPAREWFRSRLAIRRGRTHRWCHSYNANRLCRAFVPSSIAPWGEPRRVHELRTPTLEAIPGSWRLPRWPTRERASREARIAFKPWSYRLGLGRSVASQGAQRLDEALGDIMIPEPPTERAKAEESLDTVTRGYALIGDDRDACKAWRVSSKQICANLHGGILQDRASWKHRPDLSLDDVRSFLDASALEGLPLWLRRTAQKISAIRAPGLFPLVKSTCYSDQGERLCQNPLHSCWRRVVDSSGIPFSSGWKTVGRPARCYIQEVGASAELFDLNRLEPGLRRTLAQLSYTQTDKCRRCGTALECITIVVADADQAFEACYSVAVLPAWDQWCSLGAERGLATTVIFQKAARGGLG